MKNKGVMESVYNFVYERARKKGKMLFDSPKISLSFIGKNRVSVLNTNYVFSHITNDLMGKALTNEDGDILYEPGYPIREGKLLDLDDSWFSDHIGGNALVVTNDKRVLIWQQSDKNMISVGKKISSASGSIEWIDVLDSYTLQDLVEKGLKRELIEENGFQMDKEDIREYIELKTISFQRILSRGGLPNFSAIGNIKMNYDDVKINEELEDKGIYVKINSIMDLHDVISEYKKGDVSYGLHTCFVALDKMLNKKKNIDVIKKFLNLSD